MDEETNKIKQHIDLEREELGRNFDEIEYRMKRATDLKGHFDRNTGWILGAAVAGGFLLSRAFRKPRVSHDSPLRESNSVERKTNTTIQRRPTHLNQVSETLDNIFEGLVAVASDKLRSFVAETVPGFQKQYDAIDQQRGRSSVYQMKPKLGPDSDTSAVQV